MDDDPCYSISITCVSGRTPHSDQLLVDAISLALKRHNVRSARISVALVDDLRIARMNEQYLGHAGPTDVITFNLKEGHAYDKPSEIEGEIVVSTETATSEAERRGHDWETELALYVVHGTLHLLGHDDLTEGDAARMHSVEDELLTTLGVGPVYRKEPL